MALRRRPCALSAALKQQRHITPNATEEIKLDGYRAIAFKKGGKVQLRTQNENDFSARYPSIAEALMLLWLCRTIPCLMAKS